MLRTVKELRALIADVPDDTPVLTPGADHGYTPGSFQLTTVLQESRRAWCEDHGEALTPEATYGKRITALVVE